MHLTVKEIHDAIASLCHWKCLATVSSSRGVLSLCFSSHTEPEPFKVVWESPNDTGSQYCYSVDGAVKCFNYMHSELF